MLELEVNNGIIALNEQMLEVIREAKRLEAMVAENKAKMDEFKEALKVAMQENGIKKFENDEIVVTYIDSTVKKTVDTKALKEQGLYDLYLTETPVKASVRVKFK